MKYLVANKQNLKKRSMKLLGNKWTEEAEKELLASKTMKDFNKALKGYGIEYVKSINGKDDFSYVNLGDSYILTICFYKGKARICCYSDIVERNMENF